MKYNKHSGGIALITIGIVFFLKNFVNIIDINWDYIWPLILIVVGVGLLFRTCSSKNR